MRFFFHFPKNNLLILHLLVKPRKTEKRFWNDLPNRDPNSWRLFSHYFFVRHSFSTVCSPSCVFCLAFLGQRFFFHDQERSDRGLPSEGLCWNPLARWNPLKSCLHSPGGRSSLAIRAWVCAVLNCSCVRTGKSASKFSALGHLWLLSIRRC